MSDLHTVDLSYDFLDCERTAVCYFSSRTRCLERVTRSSCIELIKQLKFAFVPENALFFLVRDLKIRYRRRSRIADLLLNYLRENLGQALGEPESHVVKLDSDIYLVALVVTPS